MHMASNDPPAWTLCWLPYSGPWPARTQIMHKYCMNTAQILHKYCRNSAQILQCFTRPLICTLILHKYCTTQISWFECVQLYIASTCNKNLSLGDNAGKLVLAWLSENNSILSTHFFPREMFEKGGSRSLEENRIKIDSTKEAKIERSQLFHHIWSKTCQKFLHVEYCLNAE